MSASSSDPFGLDQIYYAAADSQDTQSSVLTPSYTDLKKSMSFDQFSPPVLIGKGAVKEVFRAFDRRIMRDVAIARPLDSLPPEFYELFVYEAKLNASLSHPNIIKIYSLDLDEDLRPFFTMDLKSNKTLKDFIDTEPSFSSRINVFLKICDAISYAHSKSIIHLDLKPENVQCDEHGEVLVCDWGLSKLIDDTECHNFDLHASLFENQSTTLYGEIKGTPGYMAPEQIIPGALKDQRTDLYALGCLLYFIFMQSAHIQARYKRSLSRPKMVN